MSGLGYLEVQEDLSYKGPIDKFIPDELKAELRELAGLEKEDTIFFIADKKERAASLAGQIRNELGQRLGICEKNAFRFCFVNDFPMFEKDPETKEIGFTHNPFSMPQGGLEALNSREPLEILAYQYDIVCNGVELSSGAVRNHNLDVMVKAFEIAGYDEEVLKQNPQHEDAKFNLEYLKQQKQQQQQSSTQNNQDKQNNKDNQQQSQQNQQSGQQNQEQNQSGKSSEQSEQQPDKNEQQNADSQQDKSDKQENSQNQQEQREDDSSGEGKSQAEQQRQQQAPEADKQPQDKTPAGLQKGQDDTKYDEEVQAREQQYREIPEDPGGLLRAFIYQEYMKNRYNRGR